MKSITLALAVMVTLIALSSSMEGQGQSLIGISNMEIVTIEEDLMIVTWVTNVNSDTTVRYGSGTTLDQTATGDGDTRYHYCIINGLDPDTEYSFQVSSGGSTSSTERFTTLPQKPSGSTRIAILADIHLDVDGTNLPGGTMYGESPVLLSSFIDEYNVRGDIEAVILLGDNVQGDEADWSSLYEDTLDPNSITYYPVMGNWDKSSTEWETYYHEYIGFSSTYYSIDIGDLHLIMLDSAVAGQTGGSIDEDQLDWLEDDLSQNADANILIFMHHLYYADSIMGLDESAFSKLKTIVDENPNILNIFSGHNHQNTYDGSEDSPHLTTVASLVQYPIGYNILDLWGEGYSQSYYKVKDTLETSENSRIRIQASNVDPDEDETFLGTIFERNHVLESGGNSKPEIREVTAGSYSIAPGEETSIFVDAIDPDGDNLEYYYGTGGGEIIGSGSEVIYRAPDREGQFGIEVTVSDGELESYPFNILISVQEEPGPDPDPDPEPQPQINDPPKIGNVIANPPEVVTGGEVRIRVFATDPDDDPLEYEYSYSHGEIIGEGNDVKWKAPSIIGRYTVTISVSDGYSGSDVEDIDIDVIEKEEPGRDSPGPLISLVALFPLLMVAISFIRRSRRR